MAEQSSVSLSRLVAMARFIDTNPDLTIEQVAEHFGRTRSQMKRDLSVLLEAGFDDLLPGRTLELDYEQYEHSGTLRLISPLGLDQGVVLTSPDLAILLYGLQAIAPTLTDAELAEVPGAISKAAALAGMSEVAPLPFIETIGEVVAGDKLQLLRRAVDQETPVRFDYVSGDGIPSSRVVHPVSLSFIRDGWLLDAMDTGAGAMRSFRLDRMGEVSPAREAKVADFEAADTRGEPESVIVQLDPSAAWVTLESAARRISESDEEITAEYSVWDRTWLRTELLLLARYVHATDPSDYARDASEFAAQAALTWQYVLAAPDPHKAGETS